MISRLTVSNYRSLGPNVVVDLGRLTALVGPNGCGKSNVADALQFVAESMSLGLEAAVTKRHGIAALRRWGAGRPFDLTIRIELRDPGASYEFTLTSDRAEEYRVKHEAAEFLVSPLAQSLRFEVSDGRWTDGPAGLMPPVAPGSLALPLIAGDERFRPLADHLRAIQIYSIFPDTLREPQKPDLTRPMQRHGENWCAILKGLRDEPSASELRSVLGRLTGDIDDFRAKQVGGFLVAEFRHAQDGEDTRAKRREKWFDAAQESDGTLRVAGIVTALLQEPPLTLVGVEEPELTVHVGALPLLYDYLVEASARSQVLITTHSPELLDRFDVDDVRVVSRGDGVTTVTPMDPRQRAAVKERLLTLGELVKMEGLHQGDPTIAAGAQGS